MKLLELKEVPVVTVKPKRNELWFVGDLHFDAQTFRYEYFEVLKKKVRGRDVVLFGDVFDYGFFDNLFSQFRRVLAIKKLNDDIMNEIRTSGLLELDRLLTGMNLVAVCQGNHDIRAAKRTGEDFLEYLTIKMGASYIEGVGILNIEADRNYKILITHGSRGGRKLSSPLNELEDLLNIVEGVDVVAIGHHHKPLHASKARMYIDNGKVYTKRVELISVGSFLGYEAYSQKRGYSPPIASVFKLKFKDGVQVEEIKLGV